MARFVARQPILDREERVYGYELLLRGNGKDILQKTEGKPAEQAGAKSAFPFEELEELSDGARVFVKCPRSALVGGAAAELPRDRVVLEVQATPDADVEVLKACRELKQAGFLLALDNFHGAWDELLADVVSLIKLDVTALPDRAQWLFIKKYRPRGAIFVADKVDNRTQFQVAVQQGYSYYQGKFFLRSQPYSTTEVAPTKLVYLLVLGAVVRPEIDMEEVARTIKHDLALSYKLLHFLNSARFAFHSPITSVRHALMMLGQTEIRKWIGTISVAALGEGGPPILVALALIRGAFCEYLAPLLGEPKRQSDFFFLGLLSGIDVLLRRPMRLILGELRIAPDVAEALMGEQKSPLRDVLRTVISYEQGQWEEFAELAKKLRLNEGKLCGLYGHALRWSQELTHARSDESAQLV